MKICTKCLKPKRRDAFRKFWGRSSDGLRPLCRDCQKKYEKFWRLKHKEQRRLMRAKRRDKDKIWRREYNQSNRANYLCSRIRKRCLRKKLPFDLDEHLSELNARISRGVCEISGTQLRLTQGTMSFNSPSLDRIIPSAGYVYSNIRVVCFAMNAAMGNWGLEKTKEIMNAWLGRK